MKTASIGFVHLVSIFMLVVVSLHSAQEAETEVQPPDLRTRKSGSDWDRFLGPTGDGKSPETSLLHLLASGRSASRLGSRDRYQLRRANHFSRTTVHVRSSRRVCPVNLHEK